MTGVVITGCGILSAAGSGLAPLAALTAPVLVDAGGRFDAPLPHDEAPMLADFDIRTRLGRKGTSFFDRATGLAIVAAGDALADAGLDPATVDRERTGIVLGTTAGSLKSTMDYSSETLLQERPYLVNPVLFPNTVMNCAAGQAAIWFKLRGVNATVAGGQLALLNSLRYGLGALRRGIVDVLLIGAVEEFSPHSAWAAELTGRRAGEAATVFVVERAGARPEQRVQAEILAVAAGFSPRGSEPGVGGALAGCVTRVLAQAGVGADEVPVVATADAPGEHLEADAARTALGREPLLLNVVRELGDCSAASGGLALASVLANRQAGFTQPGLAVVTGHSPDGAVAAALVRG